MGTIQMRVRWEKRREFLQTMEDLMALLRALRGCRSYRFYVNNEDDAAFQLVSEWQEVAQFERHLSSSAFRVFRGSRPLLSGDPEAQLDIVSQRETLDTAQGWTFSR